ncbi:uncharacterized protein LOC143298802 [Babylonia areolata]|uniref:uncharacterized protein LOC143298802 n=1 Tax=Babylonia areolata TaxID=304850 RepID=UPI003FD4F1B7
MTRSRHVLGAFLLLLSLRHVDTQDNYVIVPGDVTFAAMFTVNGLQDGACGQYDVETMQSILGVTWFIEALNGMDYIPGVRLGLDVYRTCMMTAKATEGAIKLLDNYDVMSGNAHNKSSVLFGVLGPERTSEVLVVSSLFSSLPASQRLLQISGSSTGKQLSDSTRFPNFFRVIPPDDTQVKVILGLLLQLQWNYVAIIYDDDDYGRSAATELRQLAEQKQLCIPVFAGLPTDTTSSQYAIKANQIASELKSAENGLVRGVVILGAAATTRSLLATLGQHVSYVTLVLSEAVALHRATLLTPNGRVADLARGTMVTTPPYLDIPEVTALWTELWSNNSVFGNHVTTNPWLGEYFHQLVGCSYNASGCWDGASAQRTGLLATEGGKLNLFVSYQVKATAVMAALLKQLHDSTCGTSARGVCSQLQQQLAQRQDVLDTLRHVTLNLSVFSSMSSAFSSMTSVTFNDTTGDVVTEQSEEDYTVFNFRQDDGGNFNFIQIGSWVDDSLTINTSRAQFYDESQNPLTWSELPPAQCPQNHDCVSCERDVSQDIVFMEGDFYIVGMMGVSEKNEVDVLQCGPVKPLVGADLVQSMLFAVQQVNKKTGIFRDVLPGRRVGLIVINTCGSAQLVKKRLMDLHTAGAVSLPGLGDRDTASLVDNIMGYVGAYFSSNSMAAVETLNGLRRAFVQVSGSSTASSLSDTRQFPNFLRLFAADDKQAMAILDIVQSLGANYIQVIYDNSTAYASGLFKELQNAAQSDRFNICITQGIATTPQPEVSQYLWIKGKLRNKDAAKIVVVILHHLEIQKVMDAILPGLTSGEFMFIATESWGRRQDLITGVDRVKMMGSLVLSQEIVINSFFDQYFQNLQPQTSSNPWLAYFWEAKLNCYFSKGFRRKGKSGPCPGNFAQDYVQDIRIPFFINSVYALVLGFSKTLTRICGSQATSVCQQLTSSDLFAEMLKVQLDLYGTGQATEVFDSNGDGLVGYKVLQIERDDSSASAGVFKYSDVGSWTRDKLTLERGRLLLGKQSTFQTVCPNHIECSACFPPHPADPGGQTDGDDDRVSVAVFAGVVVVLVLIIAALLVVVVLFIHRRRQAAEDDPGYSTVYPVPGAVQPPLPQPRACSNKPKLKPRLAEKELEDLPADYIHPIPSRGELLEIGNADV